METLSAISQRVEMSEDPVEIVNAMRKAGWTVNVIERDRHVKGIVRLDARSPEQKHVYLMCQEDNLADSLREISEWK